MRSNASPFSYTENGSSTLAGGASRSLGTGLKGRAWRRSAQACAEGIVNLGYALAMYRLVGGAALGVLRVLVNDRMFRLLNTALLVLVGVAALLIVSRIFRSAGPIPAALVLTVGWTFAATLPTVELDLSSAPTVAAVAQLVVGAGLLVLLLAHRTAAATRAGAVAAATLGRLLVDARPGISPEQANASRLQIQRLSATLIDFHCGRLFGARSGVF